MVLEMSQSFERGVFQISAIVTVEELQDTYFARHQEKPVH